MEIKPNDGLRWSTAEIVSLGKGKMSCMRCCYLVDVLLGCISPCRRASIACLTGNYDTNLKFSCLLGSLLPRRGFNRAKGEAWKNSGYYQAGCQYRKYYTAHGYFYSTDTVSEFESHYKEATIDNIIQTRIRPAHLNCECVVLWSE